jgi:Domain of unknown function (DUF5916)/Carbohydrate family 9 binding domain-like
MLGKIYVWCLLVLAGNFSSSAQSSAPFKALRIEGEIKLDGKLNEPEWEKAGLINEFMQAKPTPGSLPSETTWAKIIYDDNNIYVAVRANDNEADKILANNLVRDKYYGNDDGITLIFDTYNDKTNGVDFYSNSLGARVDVEVIGNDGNVNESWNTFWDVVASRDEKGYTLEYRIPFSSLRFERKEINIMGMRIIRQIARKNEFVIFPKSELNVPNIIWRVNTSAEIEFSNLKAKKPVYFTPYVNFNFAETNVFNNSLNKFENKKQVLQRNYFSKNSSVDKLLSNMGADIKLGLSKNLTLDITANTDFAHAEVDNRIINITRFSVNLPEKRAFFLESSNFLSYALSQSDILFNSRNIGIAGGQIIPIVGGIRLTGKIKGLQLGLLNMQTKGIRSDSLDAENFSVFRFRREIKNNGSFFGGILTNRMSTNVKGKSNQVVGIDYFRRANNLWAYGLNLAGSKDNSDVLNHNNLVYNAYLIKNVDRGFAHFVNLMSFGKKFNPASGFIADRGYKEVFISNSYTWYLKKAKKANTLAVIINGGKKWRDLAKLYPESAFLQAQSRLLYKTGFSIYLGAQVKNDSLPYDWQFSPSFSIPKNQYTLNSVQAYLLSSATGKLVYDLESEYGQFYGGKKIQLNPNVVWNMNKHFRFVIDYYYILIDFPASYLLASDSKYINHLAIATIYYSYSTKWSFKGIIQYDNKSKTLGTNLKLRYNPKEGSDLYIVYSPVYNTSLDRMNPHLPLLNNQALTIKFTKTFDINN